MAVVCQAMDPRIPTIPERSTSGFHRPGKHHVRQAPRAKKCVVWGDNHVMRLAVVRRVIVGGSAVNAQPV